MIGDLFPPGVMTACADVDARCALLPGEEELASRMVPARRHEFATGRACARRALAALGYAEAPILRAARRAPRWPDGVVGSITHTGGWCAAAVAKRSEFAGLGLDAERLERMSQRVLARVCSERERARFEALPDLPPAQWGAVAFSAKESLYKAYFPLTQHFLGFADAEVEIDAAAHRFAARLTRADAPDGAGRRRFEGHFSFRDGIVVTALALPA